MRRAPTALALALTLTLGASAPAAHAADDVAAAEQAYQGVDFERARAHAERALARGGHDSAATARLELLRGLASAALGRHEEAYAAFVRLLAIEPDHRLERALSPRLRAPYLEARGFWGTSERLGASARPNGTELQIAVTDPARMVRSLRVTARSAAAPPRRIERPAARQVTVDLAKEGLGGRVAYELELLDEHANVVHRQSSQLELPPLQAPAAVARREPAARPATGSRPNRAPFVATSIALGVLGAAAATGGVYSHLERERRAREWNGSDCERPAGTRGEQCRSVDDARRNAEYRAIGLYAGAVALLAASLVTLLVAPRTPRETSAALACTAGLASVACSGRF